MVFAGTRNLSVASALSGPSPQQLTSPVGQSRSRAATTQEETDVVWRYTAHGGVVGQRRGRSLGTVLLMPVPNSGTSTLPSSVTWAQDDSGQAPAKSWGPAVGGTRRVKDLPLTMDQMVAIKGEVRTCTVQVTAG